MTILFSAGEFVARCDDNPHCYFNELGRLAFAVQSQETLASAGLDLTVPNADDGEALHGNDGAAVKKTSAQSGLTKIEKKQLDRFCDQLRRDGWIVRTDRSRPLGLGTICRNHNPAKVWPRPPPDLDW